jgi:hypothetical protein
MNRMTAQFCLCMLTLLVVGCGAQPPQVAVSATTTTTGAPIVGPIIPVGDPEIRDLSPTTELVSNCGIGGGIVIKHPSMTVLSNHSVEWEVGGTAGTGVTIGEGVVPGGISLIATLEGHYTTGIDQGIQQTTSWDLPAEPDTLVEYTLMWREVWQPGVIEVRLPNQERIPIDLRYRTGIQSEIIGKRVETCTGEATGTQAEEPLVLSNTPVPEPPIPTIAPTPEVTTEVISVWSTDDGGVEVPISQSGMYEISYLSGAYTPWPNEQAEGYRGWTNIIYIYINKPVTWGITEYGLPGPVSYDRYLGPGGYYIDPDEAAGVALGERRTLRLDEGDFLTLVVLDEQERYEDNQGDIDVGIKYLGP